MNLYKVSFVSNVIGASDYSYVMAENENDAFNKIAFKLDTNKSPLTKKYGRFIVTNVN